MRTDEQGHPAGGWSSFVYDALGNTVALVDGDAGHVAQ